MSDRIETIAELKKAIREIQNYTEIESRVIELIDAFEASVKKRLNYHLKIARKLTPDFRGMSIGRIQELRRLLGEGAGHDAGTG